MDLTLIYLLSFGFLLLIAGYRLPFIDNISFARSLAWVLTITTVFFSTVITWDESGLYRMAAIVSLQLLSMKAVVVVETYHGKNNLTFMQWCAFALGWFGMRPTLFEKLPSHPLPFRELLIKGSTRIIVGLILILISIKIASSIHIYFASELFLLVGLSFILHFGILNVSTAGWRLAGVDVRELFRSPYRSKSLREFWGKRWNLAFSEMTALIAFRPLKMKVGTTAAMFLSFLLSGILHEIAISFPAKSGYGLPLLYFAIHGVLMYAEDRVAVIQTIVKHKVLSHVWVMFWLIIPMPLLFHKGFIDFVLKPLGHLIIPA